MPRKCEQERRDSSGRGAVTFPDSRRSSEIETLALDPTIPGGQFSITLAQNIPHVCASIGSPLQQPLAILQKFKNFLIDVAYLRPGGVLGTPQGLKGACLADNRGGGSDAGHRCGCIALPHGRLQNDLALAPQGLYTGLAGLDCDGGPASTLSLAGGQGGGNTALMSGC